MAPDGTESTWKTYSAFQNTFHPKVKGLIRWLEWTEDRLDRLKVSLLFNQTCLKEKHCLCIYNENNFYMAKSTCNPEEQFGEIDSLLAM